MRIPIAIVIGAAALLAPGSAAAQADNEAANAVETTAPAPDADANADANLSASVPVDNGMMVDPAAPAATDPAIAADPLAADPYAAPEARERPQRMPWGLLGRRLPADGASAQTADRGGASPAMGVARRD